MTTIQFKTNINCSGCVAKTTPYLNEAVGADNWKVDTQNPGKILTVSATTTAEENAVITAIKKAGYKAEKI